MKHTRFSIAPAGWFSVFTPTRRSSRLTEHSHYPYLQPLEAREPKSSSPRFALLQTQQSLMRGRHFIRTGGITLAAATTMWLLLSWLCSYGTWQ